MAITRSDLDGQRLIVPGQPDIWLIFHGERHRVPARAYERLFSETECLVTSVDVDQIKMGEDLDEAVTLVRGEGTDGVYLVSGSSEGIRRYPISDYQSFLDFGFDPVKTRDVPEILVRGLEEGDPLTSPPRQG